MIDYRHYYINLRCVVALLPKSLVENKSIYLYNMKPTALLKDARTTPLTSFIRTPANSNFIDFRISVLNIFKEKNTRILKMNHYIEKCLRILQRIICCLYTSIDSKVHSSSSGSRKLIVVSVLEMD